MDSLPLVGNDSFFNSVNCGIAASPLHSLIADKVPE